MCAQSQLLPNGGLGILRELAASGKHRMGVLNNEARETNEYRFRRFGLREGLDVALSSCYLGLRKPEPAIYRRALDILGTLPERVLFIDDREENAAAAEAAGMRAIRFKGAEALRRELESFGVF
jgi:putative hydrolase of the HAD superfamily